MGAYSSADNLSRVVITGLGAITPVGNNPADMWAALLAGRSGAGPITLMDATPYACQIAGEIKDFTPEEYIPRKLLRQMPLSSQLAVVASDQAVADAGIDLDRMDRDRMGVVLGTAGGNSIDETEKAAFKLANSKSARLSPFLGIKVWPNMASYFVAERHNLRGYNMTVCTACASGNQAIGEAAKIIQRGDADLILAGGTEYLLSQTIFASFTMARGLSANFNNQPEKAMRPFDADRDGFIPGLGSAILVLERLDLAQRRGARIYAEILGFGASNDSYNLIAPDPDGSGAALAIKNALSDARIHPEAVDYINAHGTSTPLGDKAETNAIKTVFGDEAYKIPISSTKSMVGHMMGAAGAVEALVCALSIYESRIHPTINYDTPDPDCDLDYVPNIARDAEIRFALSNSFGLGGQNACLVLGRLDRRGSAPSSLK